METWREIVDDIKNDDVKVLFDEDGRRVFIGEWARHIADRIEAACKTMEDVLIVEQEENAKLRRALEPVMNCVKLSDISEVFYAVREAQAIMKEGAE